MFKNPPIQVYAIHHTASFNSGQRQLYAVNRYHKDKDWGGGWKQPAPSSLGWYVGYNYFIDVDGTITQTRRVGEETIAQKGHNCDIYDRCDVVSICLAGDFNRQLPNKKQTLALRSLIWNLEKKYPGIRAKFHRDLQAGRTCPGVLYTRDFHFTEVLGEPVEPDPVDKEKAEKIAQLYDILDQLRGLLAKLKLSRKV